MNTKKITMWVDLEQKLELSTYCPEKALHLTMELNHGKAISRNESGIVEFRKNFRLIWKYREGICNTPELSNIIDDKLGAGASFAGLSRISLGALLIKYNNGLLRCGHCTKCDCPTLGYFSARGLSGHGWHSSFCPNCGEDWSRIESRLDELFYHRVQLCPVVDTPWKIHDLIVALEKLEAVDE